METVATGTTGKSSDSGFVIVKEIVSEEPMFPNVSWAKTVIWGKFLSCGHIM